MSGLPDDPYGSCDSDPTLVPREVEPVRRAADLDPIPIGQLQSTTIIAALTGIVAMLASVGVKWGMNETQKKQIAEGILAIITIGSLAWAWVGRVRAKKQVSATKLVTKTSKSLPFLLLAIFCTGCLGNLKQSPLVQIYSTKSAVATAYDEFDSAVRSGMIKDPVVLKSAYVLIPEINKTLVDATLKAKMGDGVGYQFLWEQLQDKLTRFLKLMAPANREPTSLWEYDPCPLQSSPPSSHKPSLASSNFSRRSRSSNLAALSTRSSRLWLIFTCSSQPTA